MIDNKDLESNDKVVSKNTVGKKSPKPKKIPNDALLTFKNGTMSRLVYGSSRTLGYKVEWEKPTSDNPNPTAQIELSECIIMRNSAPKFFKKNWILPADDTYTPDEILKAIGVLHFYKNCIDTEKLEEFFELSASEISNTVASLSDGQKETVYYKAIDMYKQGTLSDLNKIKAIEKIMGKPIIETV